MSLAPLRSLGLITSDPQVALQFHFFRQRNKVHVEGIIMSNCSGEAADERCCGDLVAFQTRINGCI